jgi:hypothetical protein
MKSLSTPVLGTHLFFGGRGLNFSTGYPVYSDRALRVSFDQRSVTHLHTIEFDSGLLIRLSDLQLYAGTMTPCHGYSGRVAAPSGVTRRYKLCRCAAPLAACVLTSTNASLCPRMPFAHWIGT